MTGLLETAECLFETACENGWDTEKGGLYYTFDHTNGEAVDCNKYYWAHAEMIAASGIFASYYSRINPEKASYYMLWYE